MTVFQYVKMITEELDFQVTYHCLVKCVKIFVVFILHQKGKTVIYMIYIRTVYGLRNIGKGRSSGKILFSIMDLPNPPTKFAKYVEKLRPAVIATADYYMKEAVKEAVVHLSLIHI